MFKSYPNVRKDCLIILSLNTTLSILQQMKNNWKRSSGVNGENATTHKKDFSANTQQVPVPQFWNTEPVTTMNKSKTDKRKIIASSPRSLWKIEMGKNTIPKILIWSSYYYYYYWYKFITWYSSSIWFSLSWTGDLKATKPSSPSGCWGISKIFFCTGMWNILSQPFMLFSLQHLVLRSFLQVRLQQN